jgi:HlyD family secretion protein
MSMTIWNGSARRPVRIGLLLLVVATLAAIAIHRIRRPADQAATAGEATFEVQRGPLTISFALAGTIQAAEQQIIVSEVEGESSLIYLIEEGKRVAKGELLVELESSKLRDALVEQQIKVQNANAAYVGSRETKAVTKSQGDSEIALAELKYRFAGEDLKQCREGQHKQDLMKAESKITLAEEEQQLASRKLEWSEKLFKESYLSQADLDADRLAFNRAKLDRDLAVAEKNLLENFTYKREMDKLESEVEQTRCAMERAKLKASADNVQADADFKAKEAELQNQQEKEKKIKEQIAKTRIVAPRDGVVVYATSVRVSGWRGGSQEPLETGQQIKEKQELIYLPTADEMIAEVQVHESNLNNFRLGLPVSITVDAMQGKTFIGVVSRIAPLPDPGSMWMNPDLKVYPTEIKIEGTHPELRTGMSCMAEVIVDRYEDALYIPVQAVLRVNGKPTVYVGHPGDFKPVEVKTGLDNNRMVRILDGLAAGQTVLLTPPLREGALGEEERQNGRGIDGKRLRAMIDAAAKEPAGGISHKQGAADAPPQGGRPPAAGDRNGQRSGSGREGGRERSR